MRQVYLIAVLCLFTATAFGQLKIDAEGFNESNNVTVDGVMGAAGLSPAGVLTVKSHRVHESYKPLMSFSPSLVLTQSQMTGVYAYSNVYNNRVNFSVSYDGQVYTKFGLITTSDSLCKDNIMELQPTMSKIRSLRGVSFDYKDDTDNEARAASLNDETDLPMGATPEISRQIAEERSRKRIGLIAQDVEKVFPEAVRTTYDGVKGILYNDLVGVLVEGMKELQDSLVSQATNFNARIAFLEQQLASFITPGQQKVAQNNDHNGNGMLGQGQAGLYQNTPNPFNQETEISYRLPENAATASICIYNLNGQQLKKYPLLLEPSVGRITLSASEFTPGMYIYSLVINNRVADSKRMTLTD